MRITQKILSHIYFLSKVLPKAAQVSHVHNALSFLPQNNKVLAVGQLSWLLEVFKMTSDKEACHKKGDVTEILMAGKERMEIFTNTYEDATVKTSTVGCWVKQGRWPKQRNIKAKAGWRAVWQIINALTYFAQHSNMLLLTAVSPSIFFRCL
jgi:hypothetical protein